MPKKSQINEYSDTKGDVSNQPAHLIQIWGKQHSELAVSLFEESNTSPL